LSTKFFRSPHLRKHRENHLHPATMSVRCSLKKPCEIIPFEVAVALFQNKKRSLKIGL
jgi:hypothetical protein